MAVIVALKNVVKDYPLGATTVRALRKVDLEIDEGEFTVIAGPSGSGKSTLLNLIGCIDVATSGEVNVAGENTATLNDNQLTQLRLRKIGFIFQSFNLIAVLDVFQNIEFPLLLQGRLTTADREARVMDVIEKVGLRPQLHQRPSELSGGQRQRVAIARALVTRPKLVLADEPTANLDSVTGGSIITLMRDLNRADHTTFIFSTHDQRVMEQADRVVNIHDGVVSAQGLGALDPLPGSDGVGGGDLRATMGGAIKGIPG
ncbi:MAG: ABC transporter ATP-binding protein [Myxococcales bacterium]|nr:ABC transporter ATP-binding protein [Myxococcales bacterium]